MNPDPIREAVIQVFGPDRRTRMTESQASDPPILFFEIDGDVEDDDDWGRLVRVYELLDGEAEDFAAIVLTRF